MIKRPIILKKFDEVFDKFNEGKMSKPQMIEYCSKLYKKLPAFWKAQVLKRKKEGNI